MIEAIIGLVIAVLGLGGFSFFQFKQNKALKKEDERQEEVTEAVMDDRDEVIEIHNGQQAVQEGAREEKKELDETEDSELDDRANDLFP